MDRLIIELIKTFLYESKDYMNLLLESLVGIAMKAENHIDEMLGVTIIEPLFDLFLYFGVSLIMVKFLKNVFTKYVLWTDGDSEDEPSNLILGFIQALIIAVSFPELYEWLVLIVDEVTRKALDIMAVDGTKNLYQSINEMVSSNLFNAIIGLIFSICFFYLYIQFISRGVEIMILRIGLPLSCVGLMDRSDSNVFKTYIQKFIQSTFSVIVQIILARLSISLFSYGHPLWGIASILLAIKSPKLLQEFLIVGSGQGGGLSNKLYSTARIYQISKTLFKK